MSDSPTLVSLVHDGLERSYLLHLPAGNATLPLVVELHGRGIPPHLFDRWTDFAALADAEGFALVMPAAVDEIWNDGRFVGTRWDAIDDVGFLRAVIDDASRRAAIDRTRIYLVGMSNGATMAGRFALQHPERVAGLAQVAGTVAEKVAATHHPSIPVPVISFHGSADRFAPYAGGPAQGVLARLLLRRLRAAPSLGVDDWASFWARVNGAASRPQVESIGRDVTVRRWDGSSPMADLAFYRVEGGGHTWPGSHSWIPPHLGRTSRSIDATATIWDFLRRHWRPGA